MEMVSKQVIKETIEAFRNEANKQFHYGDLDVYLNWHEPLKHTKWLWILLILILYWEI